MGNFRLKSSEDFEGNADVSGGLPEGKIPDEVRDGNSIEDSGNESYDTVEELEKFIKKVKKEGDSGVEDVKDGSNNVEIDETGKASVVSKQVSKNDLANRPDLRGTVRKYEREFDTYKVDWDNKTTSSERPYNLEKIEEKLLSQCELLIVSKVKDGYYRLIPFFKNQKINSDVLYTTEAYLIKSNYLVRSGVYVKSAIKNVVSTSKFLKLVKPVCNTTLTSNKFAYKVFNSKGVSFVIKGRKIGSSSLKMVWFKKVNNHYISSSGYKFKASSLAKIGKPLFCYANPYALKCSKSLTKYSILNSFNVLADKIITSQKNKKMQLLNVYQKKSEIYSSKVSDLLKEKILLERALENKNSEIVRIKNAILNRDSKNTKDFEKIESSVKVEQRDKNIEFMLKCLNGGR